MSELSAALGGSAPKHQIVCGDATYPVSLITTGVKVAFERALYQKARAALAEIKPQVDKDYYERKMDALVERYESGGFAMESEFGQKAMARPGGSIMLLSLLMGTTAKDPVTGQYVIIPMPELAIINLVTQVPNEVIAVFKTVVAESFPGIDVDKIVKDIDLAEGGIELPKVQNRAGLSSG